MTRPIEFNTRRDVSLDRQGLIQACNLLAYRLCHIRRPGDDLEGTVC
jgi:hypothetical protein